MSRWSNRKGAALGVTSAGAAFHTQIRRAFDIMRQADG
jgi:hypothetical protein